MKKQIKFLLILLIVAFLLPTGSMGKQCAEKTVNYPVRTNDNGNVPAFLSNNSAVYSFLMDSKRVYKEMSITSSVYNAFLSGKFKTDFGGSDLPEGINPKFYSSIPISGSLKSNEMSMHGPYTSCNWMYVTLNWSPSGSPLTVVIYDDTAHSAEASRTSTNNSIAVWASLIESHYYSVFVFNDSSRYTESYYGKITLSQK